MQDEFDNIPGVLSTEVGYTGGYKDHPTYEQVCSGMTGHTEAVKVLFDSRKISYQALVGKFLINHAPTVDLSHVRGGQYSTIVFFIDAKQKSDAEKVIAVKEKTLRQALNVDVRGAGKFWTAEDYHQHYYRKNGLGSCSR
ncbi:MAG TPA: peptide-methionine (S)-S-oxide reductase MsrA [Candidatus Melainabacteria bacterium]|nr:peptide-methionine (S)-S-oxide reductase MsrA [Candidatus Melainabacteria bacterium]HIN63554.1 peptide-methionine (S)-S-oxide reductase [Candidatus Obscuribacterales bacterium]